MPHGIACPHGRREGEVVVLQVTPRLVDVPAAAQSLGLAESTVWELVSSERLGSVKVGRRRLVPVAALDEYVERLRTEGAA